MDEHKSPPRMYWQAEHAPAARVIHGDCVSYMDGLHGREGYDLIFADPPFNIGVPYLGEVDDNREWKEYETWTKNWLVSAYGLLNKGGILYVHVPDKVASTVLRTMDFWEAVQIEWVIWHFRFGQCKTSGLINSKCHGLVFKKPGKPHTWNPQEIMVASDRAKFYGDARTAESATPGMRVPFDVWGGAVSGVDDTMLQGDGANWGRVTGSHSNAERRPLHENQLPELYLARVLKAWTKPSDWVLDPFGGSGTTITVSRALGRHCTTIEQSETYCESIVDRILKGAVRV